MVKYAALLGAAVSESSAFHVLYALSGICCVGLYVHGSVCLLSVSFSVMVESGVSFGCGMAYFCVW
jgi:hypothetical protein